MSKYLDNAGVSHLWSKIDGTFVRQEDGLGLSENNYSAEDKANLDGYGHLMAVWARNVGDMEAELETVRAENAALKQTLAAKNIHLLATPNLINPDKFYGQNTNNKTIIYGSVARHYASGRAWLRSYQPPVETTYTEEPSDKGDSYYVDDSGVWHVFKDADDFRASLVTLSEAVTEDTGESFSKALQWVITANSAWGNSENLIFNYGSDGGTREDGTTYPPYGLCDMEEGETYTLSCWARLVSGSKARVQLTYGWDQSGNSYPTYYDATRYREDITSTAWQRVHWTFVYHETIEGSSLSFKKRVGFGVCRLADATVQLCGFRLTKGGLYETTSVDEMELKMAALEARVAALEA